MAKKKKIKELEDRYYDLLNEHGVLEDQFKDLSRRFAKLEDNMVNTETDYTKYSDGKKPGEITYADCENIIKCCSDRGATKEEIETLKHLFNKYIFIVSLFQEGK